MSAVHNCPECQNGIHKACQGEGCDECGWSGCCPVGWEEQKGNWVTSSNVTTYYMTHRAPGKETIWEAREPESIMDDPAETCIVCGTKIPVASVFCETCGKNRKTRDVLISALPPLSEGPGEAMARDMRTWGKVHALKTWSGAFQAMAKGLKTFDLRQNDRDFKVGDILDLHEYDRDRRAYTGNALRFAVTYILFGGEFGLPRGYVIMAVRPVVEEEKP